jgi:hypothetical protein
MAAWWAVDIRRGALARPDRARPEILLHLAAELVTAALLVVGGAVLIARGTKGVALAGLGMLLYTVISSPGYFIARRQRAPAAMFAVLAVLTVAAIARHLVAYPPRWYSHRRNGNQRRRRGLRPVARLGGTVAPATTGGADGRLIPNGAAPDSGSRFVLEAEAR